MTTTLFPDKLAYSESVPRTSSLSEEDHPREDVVYLPPGTYWVGDITYVRVWVEDTMEWYRDSSEETLSLAVARVDGKGHAACVATTTGPWVDPWSWIWAHDLTSADVNDTFLLTGVLFGAVRLQDAKPELVTTLDVMADLSHSGVVKEAAPEFGEAAPEFGAAESGDMAVYKYRIDPEIDSETNPEIDYQTTIKSLLNAGRIYRMNTGFYARAIRNETFSLTLMHRPADETHTLLMMDFRAFLDEHNAVMQERSEILRRRAEEAEEVRDAEGTGTIASFDFNLDELPQLPFVVKPQALTKTRAFASTKPVVLCENCGRKIKILSDGVPNYSVLDDGVLHEEPTEINGYFVYCSDDPCNHEMGKLPEWFERKYKFAARVRTKMEKIVGKKAE